MATPLQLTLGGIALHELGGIIIKSQSSQFTPEEYPQREMRTLQCRVSCWERDTGYNYDILYAKIQAVRDALKSQNQVLKWVSASDGGPGDAILERPVMVVSHNIPEESQWGVYNQVIDIVFKYELDTSVDSSALTATVTGAGGVPATVNLGQVLTWKDDYKNDFYSQWKNIKQRSTGSVNATGEIFVGLGETGATGDDLRVALTLAALTDIRGQLQAGRYITLRYGPEDNRFFDHDVKVESFSADIGQGPNVGVIRWQMAISYTLFPAEEAYTGCQFISALSEDLSAGTMTLALSGTVVAPSEALAVSKLSVVVSTMTTGYGFVLTNQTKRDTSKQWVNAPDTQAVDGSDDETNNGVVIPKTAFFELTFSYAYEKKMANIISFTLNVADNDDLKSGLITRTYSGSVIASGSSEEAAYQAAQAKAKALGDKKHAFRLNSTITRSDRQMASQSSMEFMRVDFSFAYQIKGERIFLEMSTTVENQTFGESTERVTGYVVARDLGACNEQYQALVRANYADRLIRAEVLDERQEFIGLGDPWTDSTGTTFMPIRLDFSLSAFKAKDASQYAIKYGTSVSLDYVALSQQTEIRGLFVGSASQMAAVESDAANPLKTFLQNIGSAFGSLVAKKLDIPKELVASSVPGSATALSVEFSASFVKTLSSPAAVLKCSLSESITYSGNRNVVQDTPDGLSTVQNCGTTVGQRTVSGSVVAATEAAALNYISTQHGAAGLLGRFRGTAPVGIFEEPMSINTSFEFIPLLSGVGRGAGVNIQVCSMDFSFRQVIPNYPAPF